MPVLKVIGKQFKIRQYWANYDENPHSSGMCDIGLTVLDFCIL